MRKESAGIQFEPSRDIMTSHVWTRREWGLTSAKDPDVIDLEEEGSALLVDELVLHYSGPAEGNLLSLGVESAMLYDTDQP